MSAVTGAFGPPLLTGVLRQQPEDFRVEEIPAFEPSGEGEHLMLEVEKRGLNTAHVAGCLARWAGVPDMAIGYAGLKDRHAVTRQRFSVHLPKRVAPDLSTFAVDGARIVSSAWHVRKLARGALAGNRFVLRVRDVAGGRDGLDGRLRELSAKGCPNAFGVQRFGHGGRNIEAARAMFAGRRVRRDQRSILLSAARSMIFNTVLARRIDDGSWMHGLDGDVWMLDGSHSVFGPERDPHAGDLPGRAAGLDIHPTGPMWGRGQLRCEGAAAALERHTAESFGDLAAGLEQAGLKQERRALRMRVGNLAWDWPADDCLSIGFTLPAGSYATVVLEQLGTFIDGSTPSAH